MARELGKDLKAVWGAPTTEPRDRKRLLRTLIEEVQLRTDPKRHSVRIVWKGGATTERDIVRLRGGQLKATGRGNGFVRVRMGRLQLSIADGDGVRISWVKLFPRADKDLELRKT